MEQDSGSFRDKSGYVFFESGKVLRTIMPCYKEDWNHILKSGLLEKALSKKMIIPFEEQAPRPGIWKVLNVQRIPFISYPYEWCFSQLKDAALLTLELQLMALDHSLTLKDASAYNVMFVENKPTFIDILSFEMRQKDNAWDAYGQYCSHFLAPLTLAAHLDLRLSQLSRQWINGIPLDIACSALPWKSRLSLGIYMHLFLHSAMQKKYEDPRVLLKKGVKKISLEKLKEIINSLKSTTNKISFPKQTTEWGDYYNDTNYTNESSAAKLAIVESVAAKNMGNLALDLGANTGKFSLPLSKYFKQVVSADMDPSAVEFNYCRLKENGPNNILPIVLDLSSPSPALGWANQERKSFIERCKSDFVLALALCHHLFFTAGIPFKQIAEFFSSVLKSDGIILCEYIPKKDSQIQRMLSARKSYFEDYTEEEFRKSFSDAGFQKIQIFKLPDSIRKLYLFKKTARGQI